MTPLILMSITWDRFVHTCHHGRSSRRWHRNRGCPASVYSTPPAFVLFRAFRGSKTELMLNEDCSLSPSHHRSAEPSGETAGWPTMSEKSPHWPRTNQSNPSRRRKKGAPGSRELICTAGQAGPWHPESLFSNRRNLTRTISHVSGLKCWPTVIEKPAPPNTKCNGSGYSPEQTGISHHKKVQSNSSEKGVISQSVHSARATVHRVLSEGNPDVSDHFDDS